MFKKEWTLGQSLCLRHVHLLRMRTSTGLGALLKVRTVCRYVHLSSVKRSKVKIVRKAEISFQR